MFLFFFLLSIVMMPLSFSIGKKRTDRLWPYVIPYVNLFVLAFHSISLLTSEWAEMSEYFGNIIKQVSKSKNTVNQVDVGIMRSTDDDVKKD